MMRIIETRQNLAVEFESWINGEEISRPHNNTVSYVLHPSLTLFDTYRS